MDIVTDLSSQAVSILTLLQDILKDNEILPEKRDAPGYEEMVRSKIKSFKPSPSSEYRPNSRAPREVFSVDEKRVNRISEILVCTVAPDEAKDMLVSVFFEISDRLFEWLYNWTRTSPAIMVEFTDTPLPLMSPDEWRRQLRSILYTFPAERLKLARTIHYMPVLLIQAMGEKDYEKQKILRVFNDAKGYRLLSAADNARVEQWWSETVIRDGWSITAYHSEREETTMEGSAAAAIFETETYAGKRLEVAEILLTDDRELYKWVADEEPVSFEMAFNHELDVVERSRAQRLKDPESKLDVEDLTIKVISQCKKDCEEEKTGKDAPEAANNDPTIQLNFNDHISVPIPPSGSIDPLRRAERMELAALAFSGGGIRSATFNLGVIQKLAEKGVLHHIDYLSTVSGGGYIGSWLLSWIHRSGSISKVADRLNASKSTDPLADEVRPLRWLRMYSNYLAPNASIMSADAWTIGVTWLRNTLINQSILLLLLCTALSVVEGFQYLWNAMADHQPYDDWLVMTISIVMMALGAAFAAMGMLTFDKDLPPSRLWKYGENTGFASLLLGWTLLAAYLLAGWLYNTTSGVHEFPDKLYVLIVPAIVTLLGILAISFFGKYHLYKRIRVRRWAIVHIFISSLLAILVSFLLLIGIWKIFEELRGGYEAILDSCGKISLLEKIKRFKDVKVLIYTFGIPIILEVFCIGVVIRMYIMGIYFPDERREWWGRVGAMVHRLILIWILVNAAVLILPIITEDVLCNLEFGTIVTTLGGWSAIVGAGVRLAYNSNTSGEDPKNNGLGFKELFVRLVPYLFMIGFLLIGSATLEYFQGLNFWGVIKEVANRIADPDQIKFLTDRIEGSSTAEFWRSILNTVVIGLLTIYLSQRAGVNEFTLHHFYRNRLVRAYLGATRRRTERQQTANSFTNFDSEDDISLDAFSSENYYGPYPLINTALNATVISELDRQDRKAESFLFTPLFCGFDFSATRAASYHKEGTPNYAYRPTTSFAGGPSLGTAMAISGAAVNPNMGYHSSAATAFLLSVFNVKLGWWIGNPRGDKWKNPEPWFGLAYLVSDLIGKSDMTSKYVSLSDGGHFDNMGLYELIRRRCSLIILSDAEEDDQSLCEGLAMAVRRCRIDFGVEIVIDTSPITAKDPDTRLCRSHVVEGKILYPGNRIPGKLIYIKTALNGDEPVDIRQYKMQNPKFPQQPTSDQFFTEEQFESYRKLGYHSME